MKSVIIVDDEYIVVEGIRAMIARNGMDFEVVGHAYDGISGLKLVADKKPDLVITDIKMPGMDGLALVEAAKKKTPDTIFIVLSGYQEFEYARRALSLGIKGYIDKPITMEKVKQTLIMVEKLLDEAQMSQSTVKKDQAKKNYQLLSGTIIRAITEEDTEQGETNLEQTLMVLSEYAESIEEYKEESYKLTCLALGIFFENRKEKKEEQHFPSYQNMETMNSCEEVDLFVTEIFKSMFQKIEIAKFGGMHRIVEQLLTYINQNYNRDIGLIELADMVSMNPAYLSLLFKEEVGMSYIKYLTKIRMDHAKKLLTEGYKVVEVSEMVGYSNYRYFCDIFKKNENQTPNEYKGNIRKK